MRIFLISILLIGALVSPVFLSAQTRSGLGQIQDKPVVLEPIPGVTDSKDKIDFPTFLRNLFSFLLAVGAILAVFMLVWGGVWYMTSDVVGEKEKARKRIFNAVLGLLLLFGSVLVLRTINPDLLDFKIIIPSNVDRDTMKLQTPSRTI